MFSEIEECLKFIS